MTKAEQLNALAQTLAHSTCPLAKTATHSVPGEGSPDASVIFVGEAPGKNEDATGRPFVGSAGKILDQLLGSIGLDRVDTFITSIEKFRPPGNRDPRPEEVAACFPVLIQQIEIIKPKIVVPLGRHALRHLLQWSTGTEIREAGLIESMHGKPLPLKQGFTLLPMYHPAAAIYRRALLPTLQADFQELKRLLKT